MIILLNKKEIHWKNHIAFFFLGSPCDASLQMLVFSLSSLKTTMPTLYTLIWHHCGLQEPLMLCLSSRSFPLLHRECLRPLWDGHHPRWLDLLHLGRHLHLAHPPGHIHHFICLQRVNPHQHMYYADESCVQMKLTPPPPPPLSLPLNRSWAQSLLPYTFYFCWMANLVLNMIWLLLWDREYVWHLYFLLLYLHKAIIQSVTVMGVR